MADKTDSVKTDVKPAAKQGSDDKGIRIMNIPLRSEWIKSPRNKRSKRAMNTIREFVAKHTKSYDVKVSQKINEKVWTRGIHKPPAKIRVKVSKDSKGVVNVMLPEEIMRKPDKKEKKGRLDQMKENLEKEKKIPGMGGPKEEILKKGKKRTQDKEAEIKSKETKKEEKPKEEPIKEEKPKEDKEEKMTKETVK
jgi:large subunit ribosomal protein L31e